MDKQELLDNIRHDRARLDIAIATLTPAQLFEPALEGGLSPKDVLAHITVWEQRFLREVAKAQRGEEPQWPEPGFGMADVDRLNARDYEANRARDLDEIVAESRRSYDEFVRAIDAMSDDDLTRGDRFSWTGGHPLALFASANSDDHYREHAQQIEAWHKDKGLKA